MRGKGLFQNARRLHAQDHPRVCGEKCDMVRFCDTAIGSPPRVRGKDDADARQQFEERITPACAGKSHRADGLQRRTKDHPRVCGEKLKTQLGLLALPGSPPRVRGKV